MYDHFFLFFFSYEIVHVRTRPFGAIKTGIYLRVHVSRSARAFCVVETTRSRFINLNYATIDLAQKGINPRGSLYLIGVNCITHRCYFHTSKLSRKNHWLTYSRRRKFRIRAERDKIEEGERKRTPRRREEKGREGKERKEKK